MRIKAASYLFGAASAALALALAGCGGTPTSSAGAGGSFATSSLSAPSASSASALPSPGPSSAVTSATATSTAVAGAPSSSSAYGGAALGGTEGAESGAILPDRAVTPGATNSAVSQGDISSTICVSGWTSTVRPPSSYTSDLKLDQLRAGYTYNGDLNPSDYEEDHLIPLELGGAPSDVRNLWPEPSNAATGSSGAKDQLENKLHGLVCSGQLALVTAQQAIATDWWIAYQSYVAQPAAPAAPAPAAPAPVAPAPAPAAPAPAPAPAAPAGATAQCNDGSYSYSATHSGTCSHHGGVAIWYK